MNRYNRTNRFAALADLDYNEDEEMGVSNVTGAIIKSSAEAEEMKENHPTAALVRQAENLVEGDLPEFEPNVEAGQVIDYELVGNAGPANRYWVPGRPLDDQMVEEMANHSRSGQFGLYRYYAVLQAPEGGEEYHANDLAATLQHVYNDIRGRGADRHGNIFDDLTWKFQFEVKADWITCRASYLTTKSFYSPEEVVDGIKSLTSLYHKIELSEDRDLPEGTSASLLRPGGEVILAVTCMQIRNVAGNLRLDLKPSVNVRTLQTPHSDDNLCVARCLVLGKCKLEYGMGSKEWDRLTNKRHKKDDALQRNKAVELMNGAGTESWMDPDAVDFIIRCGADPSTMDGINEFYKHKNGYGALPPSPELAEVPLAKLFELTKSNMERMATYLQVRVVLYSAVVCRSGPASVFGSAFADANKGDNNTVYLYVQHSHCYLVKDVEKLKESWRDIFCSKCETFHTLAAYEKCVGLLEKKVRCNCCQAVGVDHGKSTGQAIPGVSVMIAADLSRPRSATISTRK